MFFFHGCEKKLRGEAVFFLPTVCEKSCEGRSQPWKNNAEFFSTVAKKAARGGLGMRLMLWLFTGLSVELTASNHPDLFCRPQKKTRLDARIATA